MLQIYVGSARDLSAKNNQNTRTARLILSKKLTLRDTNMTETEKVGLQPWTAVLPFFWLQPYFIGFCRVGVSQSQFFYVVSALQFLYSPNGASKLHVPRNKWSPSRLYSISEVCTSPLKQIQFPLK